MTTPFGAVRPRRKPIDPVLLREADLVVTLEREARVEHLANELKLSAPQPEKEI